MINWNGWTGGAVAWLVFFVAILGESWILENSEMNLSAIIEAQKSTIQDDREMVAHHGKEYRANKMEPKYGEWNDRYHISRINRYRDRAVVLAEGLEVLQGLRQCDHCQRIGEAQTVFGLTLCFECEADFYEQQSERVPDEWDYLTDADYPPVPGAV